MALNRQLKLMSAETAGRSSSGALFEGFAYVNQPPLMPRTVFGWDELLLADEQSQWQMRRYISEVVSRYNFNDPTPPETLFGYLRSTLSQGLSRDSAGAAAFINRVAARMGITLTPEQSQLLLSYTLTERRYAGTPDLPFSFDPQLGDTISKLKAQGIIATLAGLPQYWAK